MKAPTERPPSPAFTTGSILRHVVVMTATGSIGLMAVFVVDVVNLFYISLLGQEELAAAIGYAGTLLFFFVSISIGLSIGVTATVSRSLGAGDRTAARRQATAGVVITVLALILVTALAMPFQADLLALMGAEGRTLAIADDFLDIVMPANFLLGIGMALSGVLRAAGDARRSMYVTLAGAIAVAVLDPIFIFALDLGVTGSAIVTVLSRLVIAGVGFHGTAVVHGLLQRPSVRSVRVEARRLLAIAVPAILTNLATPVGNAYVTGAIAAFGVEAVAAWAVIGRLFPLAFAGIFALSGAVGGIFGQNLGARRFDRVRETLTASLIFTGVYVLVIWIALALASGPISDAFQATGRTRDLIGFFCIVVAPTFVFTGALFVANAAFNNLGFPTSSTLFNWARSTLGIIPFCHVGAEIAGAEGVLAGWGIGGVVFGAAAVAVAFRAIARIGRETPDQDARPAAGPTLAPALPPFSPAPPAALDDGPAGPER